MLLLRTLIVAAIVTLSTGVKHHTDRRVSVELNLEAGRAATAHTMSLIYNRYELFDPSKYGVYLLRPYMNINE